MMRDVTRFQMIAVSQNLRRLIEKAKLTRLDVSTKLCISGATLDNWLNHPGQSGMKGANLEKVAAFFDVDPEWLLSEHADDAAENAVGHYIHSRNPIAEMKQRMQAAENDYLARDETCLGCKYYGRLESGSGSRCCEYTLRTGKIKHNPPSSCEVREEGQPTKRPDMYTAYKNAELKRKLQFSTGICSRCHARPAAP